MVVSKRRRVAEPRSGKPTSSGRTGAAAQNSRSVARNVHLEIMRFVNAAVRGVAGCLLGGRKVGGGWMAG